ncbi:flavin reductase family protein [Stetteria hydrogenophila]
MAGGYSRVEGRLYRLLHPRPVYAVASGTESRPAVMAASWVTPVAEEPALVAVAWEKESYTLERARETGYFTVNVLPAEMLDALWYVGTRSGREEPDKHVKAGLKLVKAEETPTVRVEGAIAWIEARITRVITDIARDVDVVFGEAVAAYADPNLFDPRRGWYIAKAKIPLQVAGRTFTLPGRIVYPATRS